MTYASEQDTDTPISRWKFEETSGTAIDDDKTSTRDGTLSGGATLNQAAVATHSGLGVDLDGTNGIMTVGNFSTVGLGTIEAVVVFDAIPATNKAPVFVHLYSNNCLPLALGFNLNNAHAGKLGIGYYTGSTWVAAHWSTAPSTATVYHLVGTYDGTDLKLRANGAEVATIGASPTRPTSPSPAVSATAYMGRKWDSAADCLNGRVYDLAIYSQALSAARADVHYGALNGNVEAAVTGTRTRTSTVAAVPDGFATITRTRVRGSSVTAARFDSGSLTGSRVRTATVTALATPPAVVAGSRTRQATVTALRTGLAAVSGTRARTSSLSTLVSDTPGHAAIRIRTGPHAASRHRVGTTATVRGS